jgi:hypothetical protein
LGLLWIRHVGLVVGVFNQPPAVASLDGSQAGGILGRGKYCRGWAA